MEPQTPPHISRSFIHDELWRTLGAIDRQIKTIEDMASGMGFAGTGIPASEVKDERGNFVLSPLLVAKAQILAVLVPFANGA